MFNFQITSSNPKQLRAEIPWQMEAWQALKHSPPQQQRPMTLVGPYGIELGSSNFHISSSSTPKQLEATISQTLQPPQPSL